MSSPARRARAAAAAAAAAAVETKASNPRSARAAAAAASPRGGAAMRGGRGGAAAGRGGAAAGGKGGKDGKGGKKRKKIKIVEDPKDVNLLLQAAESDNVDAIKQLLDVKERERKVDIKSATGAEALVRAAERGKRAAVTTLLSYGIRPEVSDGKAFQRAAAHAQLPILEVLLQREIEQRAIDAAELAKLKAAKKKIRRKKKKNLTPTPLINLPATTTEMTALHYAASTGSLPVMQHLIKNRANVNAVTHADNCGIHNGWTPVHFAADAGHLAALRYLYQHGANIDYPTHEGETALVLAAESGRFETVKWLVSNGADVHATRRGLDASQWALYRGHSDAAEYLIGYGAKPELNHRQVWFPLKYSLKDVLVNEFSEPLCRKLDTAIYKGEVRYRERCFRREIIDQIRWLVDVFNPREMDLDKVATTTIESFPKHICTLIWLFDIDNDPNRLV